MACATGVPISTGLGTAPTLVGDMGECAYQLVMSDNIQRRGLAEYAIDQGYSTGVRPRLERDPLHEATCRRIFSDAFEHGGGTVVGDDEYKLGAGDYSAVVTKIQNIDPTARRDLHADVHPRQRGLPAPAPAGGDHDAGALDRRERRRRVAGRRRQGDRRAHVLQLGLHRRGRPGRPEPSTTTTTLANGKDPSSYVAVIGYDEVNMVADAIDGGGQHRARRLTASWRHDRLPPASPATS